MANARMEVTVNERVAYSALNLTGKSSVIDRFSLFLGNAILGRLS